MARKRIVNAFSNGITVHLSLSGGKDSIVLADLVYQLIQEGRIDPSLLEVSFVDEEAMHAEVIRIAESWRKKFMLAGAKFTWWCIEVKHFNCFNALENDETFICWDSTKRDVWVRKMPSFAVTDHPLLKPRTDSYQAFLTRIQKNGIRMAGVRVAESLQRLNAFQQKYDHTGVLFMPIYDWKDSDIWMHIRDRSLDFPETYMHLYQTGTSRRGMRLSQFFSIDTAKSLVRLSEYEPELMERVIRREPNAYLASLYWDTEIFRSGGAAEHKAGVEGRKDYKALTYALMKTPPYVEGHPEAEDSKVRLARSARRLLMRFGMFATDSEWRAIYDMLVAGDPKHRVYRSLFNSFAQRQAGK